MGDADGASAKEQILEACRRDNMELFSSVIQSMSGRSANEVALFFNSTTDTMGNPLLHICTSYGSYDVLDSLLDVEFLEVDPLNLREKETPLHAAVRYAMEREPELGLGMVRILVEAGADPRIRDKGGRKPRELCKKGEEGEEVKAVLDGEEYILREGLREKQEEAEQREDEAGPASDED